MIWTSLKYVVRERISAEKDFTLYLDEALRDYGKGRLEKVRESWHWHSERYMAAVALGVEGESLREEAAGYVDEIIRGLDAASEDSDRHRRIYIDGVRLHGFLSDAEQKKDLLSALQRPKWRILFLEKVLRLVV